jgi:hypothetical protein
LFLTQYIQLSVEHVANIKCHGDILHSFFMLGLKNLVYILYLWHISIQTSPISYVPWPPVGSGCYIGQHREAMKSAEELVRIREALFTSLDTNSVL